MSPKQRRRVATSPVLDAELLHLLASSERALDLRERRLRRRLRRIARRKVCIRRIET